jgi:cell division protein FtsQ
MSAWVRAISIYLPIGLIVAGVSAFVIWSRQPGQFPLRKIEIRSELKHVKESDIKSVAQPFLEQGFFGLNVVSLQGQLNQLPWVESVDIRRMWPDRLFVSVRERIGQARWGEEGILSTEGVVFYPLAESRSMRLPRFIGPEGRAKEMLEKHLSLLEFLAPAGLAIQDLQLSPQGNWRVLLDNNMTIILGNGGFNESMSRFMLAYQNSLQAQSQRIAYIDLRYTNGFAIGWKEETAK